MLVLEDSFVVGLNDACGVWHAAVADLDVVSIKCLV